MLKFHNTLSNNLEEFQPLKDNEVRLYICGPTVWSFAHIGNFRTFIFGDILRRYLKYKNYKLTHVMNLTDVDDRIINEAKKADKTINEFTAPFIAAFWEDFDALGLERPEIAPRATDHIAEMIAIIEKLLENGHAYESDGSIYYRISAFPDYGKLSKINFKGNVSGASGRVDTDKYDKESANDFALWKLVDENEPTGWDASFGRGRPGWHIECSAMAMKYLGETFDIHAGGIDLKFPHHENEIAQSEGATNELFAKTWLHSEHLMVEGKTMSKSLGNYYTFRDLIEKGYSATAIRYLLMSVPYHKQLNFTFETLDGAEQTIKRLRDFRKRLIEAQLMDEAKRQVGNTVNLEVTAKEILSNFVAALDDNLNTSVALANLHNLVGETNRLLAIDAISNESRDAVLDTIKRIDSVLNIFGEVKEEMLDSEIKKLIEERQEARRNRNFTESDDIRDFLISDGITIEDTKLGARWKKSKEIYETEERILNLLNNFSGQKISGSLFGVSGEITLPKFSEVIPESKISNLRIDSKAISNEEIWWVEVKMINKPHKPSLRILEQMRKYIEAIEAIESPKNIFWLAIFGELNLSFKKELSKMNIYYSSLNEIQEIEKLLIRK